MKPRDDFKTQLTPEQESIIATVETRLAAGLTVQRLSLETGIEIEDINRLLARRIIGGPLHLSMEVLSKETAAAISAIADFLGRHAGAKQNKSEFANTPTLQSLHAIFAHTHKSRGLTAITGSWGIGKSKAAEGYVQSCPRGYQKPGAVRIEFGETDRKPTAAYSRILGALRGDRGHAYRNDNLHDAIGAALNPGDCLFMDECNYLVEAMDVVRSIHDDFGVAIVMMGNPEFTATVWGKKSRYSALASRTNRFEFPASTAEDVEAWLAWSGVLDGIKPTERTKFIEKAITIGKRPSRSGGLRALARAIEIYQGIYSHAPLDGMLLEQIINQTKGGVQ